MSVQILVKRGLYSDLSTNNHPLEANELGFATDTKQMFVGVTSGSGGSETLIGQVEEGTSLPTYSNRALGAWYYKTDTTSLYLRRSSAWELVATSDLSEMNGDLDDIADGSTYGKVKNTELDNNQVKQIRAVSATTDVTGDTIKTHLDSTSNPHSVTASQVGIDSLDDISDGTSYQRVAATEVDASGRVTQVNDGTNVITASQAHTHINSTANPHSTSIANIGNGTIAELNGAISDGTVGAGLNDSNTGTSDLWSANKIQNQIDNSSSGLSWKQAVDLATTANITLSGEQTIDGTLTSTSRILVKDQSTAADNGIYVTASGAWTRATDMDSASEFDSAAVFVSNGTANADTGFVQTANVTTVGTDTVTFVQFTGAGQINAGTGLSKSGNTLDVNLGAGIVELPGDEVGIDLTSTGGLELTSLLTGGQLKIKPDSTTGATVAPIIINSNGAGTGVDNSTIDHSSGTIGVKDAGISGTQLNSSVAGDGLAGGGGSALSVNVDDSTIEITTDTLNVKAAGITEDELNTSVAGDGLTGGGGSALAVGAGDGINVDTNDISVDPESTASNTIAPVSVTATGVGVTVDNATIDHSTGTIGVKDAGISGTQLNSSVAGNGLTGGGGSALAVGGGDGINIAADSISVDPESTASDTIAPVSVTATGVGVTIDNDTIVHSTGTLSVGANSIGTAEIAEGEAFAFTAATSTTQSAGDNSTSIATTEYVDTAVTAAELSAGNGIDISGTTIKADVDAAGAISNDFGSNGTLGILVDDSTIKITSNAIYVDTVDGGSF